MKRIGMRAIVLVLLVFLILPGCQQPSSSTATGTLTLTNKTGAALLYQVGSGTPQGSYVRSDLTFSATASTITTAAGNFVTAGFVVGQYVSISGSASNNVNGLITAVSVTSMTLSVGLNNESDADSITLTWYNPPVWGSSSPAAAVAKSAIVLANGYWPTLSSGASTNVSLTPGTYWVNTVQYQGSAQGSYTRNDLTFTAPGTVTTAAGNFVTAGFVVGQYVSISGSKKNNVGGLITAVSAASMTLSVGSLVDTFAAESDTNSITLAWFTVTPQAAVGSAIAPTYSDLTFSATAATASTISTAGGNFVAAGFVVGQKVTISGSAANNVSGYIVGVTIPVTTPPTPSTMTLSVSLKYESDTATITITGVPTTNYEATIGEMTYSFPSQTVTAGQTASLSYTGQGAAVSTTNSFVGAIP